MRFLNELDEKLTRLIRGLPRSYQPMMEGLSFIGQPWVVIPIGLAGWLSAIGRHQSAIQHAFAYAIIAFGLNTLLKLALHRTRPQGLVIKTLGLKSYSLPSGHAFGTLIFYGLFAYIDLKYLSTPLNVILALLISLLIFLVGVSRVYLKSHYPTDVLAGWLLGGLSLAIIILAAL